MKAKCKYCNKKFTARGMTAHLKKCAPLTIPPKTGTVQIVEKQTGNVVRQVRYTSAKRLSEIKAASAYDIKNLQHKYQIIVKGDKPTQINRKAA